MSFFVLKPKMGKKTVNRFEKTFVLKCFKTIVLKFSKTTFFFFFASVNEKFKTISEKKRSCPSLPKTRHRKF